MARWPDTHGKRQDLMIVLAFLSFFFFRVMLGIKLTIQQGIPGGMHSLVSGHGQHKGGQ